MINLRELRTVWRTSVLLSAVLLLGGVPAMAGEVSGEFSFTSSIFEVGEGDGAALITVTRHGGRHGKIVVPFSTIDGTATNDVDYISVTNNLVFFDSQTRAEVVIPILDNQEENENKTVTLRIYDPLPAPGEDAMLTPMLGAVSEATLNILDNDTDNAFNFARRFYQVGETAGQIEITVIFRGDAAEGVSVDYETRTGNFVTRAGSDFATEDEDFGSVSGTLEFAAAGSQTIAIPILADGLLEFNEDFQVVLFNPQREDPPDGGDDPPPPPPPAVIGQLGTATVTILPDRSPEAEHPAGSVDLDFNPDNDPLTNPPLNRTPGANNAVYALAVQPDGKIVLGGEFTSINARNRNRIARVESDGSLDESFHPGTGANDFVNAVTIMQEEGEEMKLLIGGGFSSINGQMRGSIARLNADGSLDAGFSSGLGADGPIHTMVGTPEGILVGGDFNWFDGRPRNNLALLTPEGELDTSFDPGLGANGPIYSMLAQMVEALSFGVTNSGIGPISLSTNLNTGASSGSVELTYNFFDVLGSLRVYQGTNLVHDTGLTNNIQVVEVDGVTVTNFPPIVVTFPYGGAVETALRFEVNEQPEDEEGEEGEEPEPQPEQEDLDRRWEFSAVIRPARTGAILAGGDFTTYNGEARNRIVRLLADGSIDQTFGVRTGANGPVHALVLQPDQKILLGGGFSGIDGIRREGVARLNPDGTMDRTFDPGAGADHPVFALALQADGRILAGGTFASFNGVRRIGVARLYENGVLDTSFMDTAFNQFAGISDPQGFAPFGFVSAVAVDGEGGVLIGGGFTHLGGGATRTAVSPRYNYARLIGGETEGPGNLEFQFEEYGVDENGGDAVVTLVRSNGSLGPVSVEFTTVEGVALAELDFTPVSTNVVWGFMGPQLSMGLSTTNVVRIPILDDDLVEGDETFTVELSHPRGNLLLGGEVIPAGASLGRPSRATVTIYDDDFHTGTLSFSEAEYSVIENAGSATITVNRTEGTTGMVTVRYATSDGSALEGTDYASTSGMLIFSSGQTNRTFTIPIWDNTLVEEDKTVNLRLFSPSGGARVGEQGTAVLTIIDDDFKPGRISFASTNYTVLEGEGLAQIGVQRRGGSAGFLSVQFRTREGTARAPFDFSHASGALSWSDGEAGQKFFTVPIQDNTLVNPDKTVLLELFDASVVGALTSRTNAVLTIENDDFYGELSFNSAGYLADENGGPAIINVIRRDGSAETVSVMYESSAGTATEGVDYTEVQGALVFGPGETSKSFLVPIHDNDVMDGNRTVELRLSNPMLATLGEVGTAVLTIVDDETVNRPAGSLDRDFRIGAGPNNTVYALAIQEDGRLFVGGDFTDFDQHVRGRIVRLTREGEVDETFEPETEANGTVRTLLVQDEGRIVLGGNFSRVNDRPFRHIARLSRTGALDTTFDPGAGADQPVYSLADLGRDYKLVAGGAFTLFNSRNSRFFAQLNQDGTLDSAFQAALGANGPVHAVKVLRDGKVLLGGEFTMINGVVRNFIARLNSDGSVDLSFDAGLGPDGSVRALAVQNDDKILVGGGFTSASGVPRNSVTRLNADGSLDNSFQPGAGANGPVFAIGLHANGKIVLGGDFTLFNGLTRNRIARLNEDGSMDTTINFGTGANDFVAAIAIQDDRKIVIGGGFTRFNGESRRYLARLQGGSLAGAGQVEFASANFEVRESEGSARITLRRTGGTSGAITVDYATQPGTAEPFINYRDVSGKLTFQPGETLRTFSVPILETALPGPEKTVQLVLSSPGGGGTLGRQPVGTLTIISDKSVIGFSQANFSVGEAGGNAVITLSRAGDVSVEAAVNYSTSPGTAQAGVDYVPVSGTLFFAPGQTNQSFAVPIIDDDLVEDNETVILNLSAPTGNAVLGLARATLTIIDDDFAPGVISFVPGPVSVSEGVGVVNLTVRRISGKTGVVTVNYATQDGSATAGLDYIPVSGMLTFAEGETSRTISVPIIDDTLVEGDEVFFVVLSDPTGGAVLGQPDVLMVTIIDNDVGAGSLDLSFDPGRGANGPVYAARVQPDGRIVVGGDFSTFNEVNRARVARLQLNGALDESFAPGAGPNQTVTALLPRPGGKVVIGGLFNTVNGILHNRVARLNANGTLDGGFNLPLGVNALVNALADQPDGKVLVGGMFDRASAVGRNRIARLNADGTLDVTFDPGSGANNAVQAVALQADGKVIIGGFFSSVNGVPRNGVARLHANGALDTAFAPGTGANGPVYAVLAQSDGRVLVAGEFTVFNGVSRNRIARLNANGTVDTAFNPGITGTGANNTIYALALQEGGKAVIGGNFTQFNGTGRNRIARLNANGSLDSSFDVGSGVNGPVYAVAGQADGSVILAGQFSEVDGVSRNGIARLIGDQTGLPSEVQISFLLRQGNGQMQLLFNTQPGRVYVIEGSNDLVGWGTLGTVLATGTTGDFLDVAAPTQRHRFYRVRRNP